MRVRRMIGRFGSMLMILPARRMPVKPERLRHEHCEAEHSNQESARDHLSIMAHGLGALHPDGPIHHPTRFGQGEDEHNQSAPVINPTTVGFGLELL
jgi:hypothetical protein